MFNIEQLQGCGTALVTPFLDDGKIDEASLKNLVDFQIAEGIDFLVPCGTTGESATFTLDEHLHVVHTVVDQVAGRVPVIAGAGGNNTAKVIDLARAVCALDVDGLLSVTPYYNKPTQHGLIEHYKAIANAVDKPIIVYNVPGRTSVNIQPETMRKLAQVEQIVGVKAASGNIGQIAEMAATLPDNFKIISGDCAATIPILSVGGVGAISVVSNQVPAKMSRLVNLCLQSKYKEANIIQKELFGLMQVNFIETNPQPVKTALHLMGMMGENFRLPLTRMQPENKQRLADELKKIGLI